MKAKKWVRKEKNIFWPSEELKRRAWISNEAIYKKAAKNPIAFWAKLAEEGISWYKKWKKTYVEKPTYFRWFVGGKLNACYNAVDRHITTWKKDKAAIIWEPEPIEEKNRVLTYQDLYREVNKFANVLKNLGVKKGDVVGIYLPLIPEAQIAMLACARIGAIHNVVFSAFSPDALRYRLQETEAKVLITCDGYYRRGEIIDLKKQADEGVKDTKVEKIIVVRRAGNEISWVEEKDFWWHIITKDAEAYCKPEVMGSEDPLFILYTSGCCHPDTYLQLSNGEIRNIETLANSSCNLEIVSSDISQLKLFNKEIIGWFKYRNSPPLYEVRTKFSCGTFTENHPFFVFDGKEIKEKSVRELKVGDCVLVITQIPFKGNRQRLPDIEVGKIKKNYSFPPYLTPELSQIVGYFCGDGHINRLEVIFSDKEHGVLKFYAHLIQKTLMLDSRIKKRNGYYKLTVYSKALVKLLQQVFSEVYKKTKQRSVPTIIEKSENECVGGFLRGIFDAESSIDRDGIHLHNTSKDLIYQIQILLRRFGILSGIIETTRKTKGGKKCRIFRLSITNQDSKVKFVNQIGLSAPGKNLKLVKIIGNKGKSATLIPLYPVVKEVTSMIRLTLYELRKFEINLQGAKSGRAALKEFCNMLDGKIAYLENIAARDVREMRRLLKVLKIPHKKIAEIMRMSIGGVRGVIYEKRKRRLRELEEKVLPFIEKRRVETLKKLEKILDVLNGIQHENIGFVPITKITRKIYNGEVYDLIIKDTHVYNANCFLVHNTTGKPKGVIHSTGGYLTQAYWTAKWDFDLHDEDIFWCTSDLGWITGHTYACYGSLLNGTTMLIYEGAPDFPQPDRWCEIIEKYGVTVFYTAPTAIRMFIKFDGKWVKKHDLSSLRILATVGEPINKEAWLWYFNEVGQARCPIIDTWWQTETGGTLINSLPGIGPFIPTVAGRSFPGTRHEVLDEEGKVLPPGKEGNLVQLSPFAPGMLRGIYKNPEKYFETYWKKYGNKYFTSDGAWKDKQGNFRLTGRVDDVMKVAGHRIATAELEDAITRHQAVAECAVVPLPHEIKGEVPVAFVILKEEKPSEQLKKELIKQVEKHIGPIARPSKIIFVEDLPKTRSGKIIRRILKNLLTDQPAGDITTLANPESIEKIKMILKK